MSVLLVEAGGSNQSFKVRWPMVTCPGLQNSERDWQYRTTPQPHNDGSVSHWPRGKTLGGSSSINYMLYVRGDPRNYDDWARQGCAGWGYKDVLPFFKKSENLIGEDDSGAGAHGRGGPLDVSKMSDGDFGTKDICERWKAACERALGMDTPNPDVNGPTQTGAMLSQCTVKNGARRDTASAFLFDTGALARENLTVVTDTHCTRVAFRGQAATGVLLQRGNGSPPPVAVDAAREVVVSCGAVGTPHLLLLSGVGPRAHLAAHGIDAVADLPVGENLQDHLMWPAMWRMKPGCKSGFNAGSLLDIGKGLFQHLAFGSGTLAFPWIHGYAFGHSGAPGGDAAREGNDLQIHWLPFLPKNQAEMETNMGRPKRADRPLSDLSTLPDEGVTPVKVSRNT